MQSGTAVRGRQFFRGVCSLGLLAALVGFLVGPVIAEEIREPGFLGVQLREETERAEGGALVTHVVDGSPATEAGLLEGDIVVEFEGTLIRGPLALTQRIHTRQPGETVTLTVVRDGETRPLDVVLGRRSDRSFYSLAVPPKIRVVPDIEIVEPMAPMDPDEFPDIDPDSLRERFEIMDLDQYQSWISPLTFGRKPRLGVQLVETTPELRKHLGGDEDAGVLVSKILSGLAEGSICATYTRHPDPGHRLGVLPAGTAQFLASCGFECKGFRVAGTGPAGQVGEAHGTKWGL